MSKEEILDIIREYSKELEDDMQEMITYYGREDSASQRCITQFLVMYELLSRLGINLDDDYQPDEFLDD